MSGTRLKTNLDLDLKNHGPNKQKTATVLPYLSDFFVKAESG